MGRVWRTYRTYAILIIAILAGVAFVAYQASLQNYGKEITVSFSRMPVAYDFSCNTPDYELYVTVKNNGTKIVTDLGVSISNPLCVGAIPPLTSTLLPSQIIRFYVQSTSENGTLTINGNETLVNVSF